MSDHTCINNTNNGCVACQEGVVSEFKEALDAKIAEYAADGFIRDQMAILATRDGNTKRITGSHVIEERLFVTPTMVDGAALDTREQWANDAYELLQRIADGVAYDVDVPLKCLREAEKLLARKP